MDHNQFSKKLKELQDEHDFIDSQIKDQSSQLSWFEKFDSENAHKSLMSARRGIDAMRSQINEVAKKAADLRIEIQRLGDTASLGFDPRHWFSSERKAAVQQLASAKKDLENREEKIKNLEQRLRTGEHSAVQLDSDLCRYRTFNELLVQATRRSLQIQLEQLKPQLSRMRQRKEDLDLKLGEPQRALANFRKRRDVLLYELNRAGQFERDLASARSPRERAQIHAACERDIGESSPNKVLQSRRGELRSVEDSINKLQERINRITMIAQHDVRALVIDGNNLCYRQKEFIGLSALEALIPMLAAKYAVNLIFDSGIRGRLRANDSQIQERFPLASLVHVVASREKADETILDIAGNDKHTFVISNDRFKDFPEKEAVRQDHIFRHEIVDNMILIHDLNISVKLTRNVDATM
jgi:hypothetical protein